MINDLWPDDILEDLYEENKSLELLKEQAKIICKRTNNKINDNNLNNIISIIFQYFLHYV